MMDAIKINRGKGEVIILKTDKMLRHSDLLHIRDDVIRQMKDGVAIIPCGFEFDILRSWRLIDVDIWIDKLAKIVSDPEAPGEYKDYCLHLIGEIEAEFATQKQEGEA